MPKILNSENLEFEKQDLKKKMKFHGVKNIEKKKQYIKISKFHIFSFSLHFYQFIFMTVNFCCQITPNLQTQLNFSWTE